MLLGSLLYWINIVWSNKKEAFMHFKYLYTEEVKDEPNASLI